MARKMTHAPVYFAIVQARFNPILALDSYVPQIQERFRKEGFPDVQKGVLATLNLNLAAPAEGSTPQVPVAQSTRYTFCNMDRTAGFILDQGALSFQTTEYEIFETFSGGFRRGLQAVHEAVDLSYTDRIGYRYLDAVFARANESLEDYLNPSVIGLAEKFRDSVVHSFSETNLRSANINVVARVIIQDGEVGFPPDLLPNILRLAERFRVLRGRHAILDTDGSFEGREPFSLDRIADHLNAIHDEVAKTFNATVTQNALKVWK
jgi:uncharacterized protein (TIGR04255 family)